MKTILVIDDDPLIRESVQDLLESHGFRPITASGGAIGLELAIQNHPDLILCDLQMPDMSGYEVLKAIRANPAVQTIPFIFLAAQSDRVALRQGMNLGADDYLAKPCSANELLAALNSRLEKQEVLQSQAQQQLDTLRSSIAMSLPHEFRTPLTGIFTSVELLRLTVNDSEVANDVLEIAQTIQTSAQRLYRLIQNYLFYAKLEVAVRDPAYKTTLSREVTSFPGYAIANLATTIATRDQRPDDLELDLQNTAIAIPHFEFEKIVNEVLENAFKFSPSGTPVIATSQVQNNHYHIQITNSGHGMTVEQIANLGGYMQFDRQFYEQQGVGLGLAIAQRLVGLYDGQLTITSVPHQTTTVSVVLPLAEPENMETGA